MSIDITRHDDTGEDTTMTTHDEHSAICAVCRQPATTDVRFRADGKSVHVWPCGELRIFVYGTLRTGGALERLLPSSAFSEPATALGYALHYPKLHRSYPYMIADESAQTVGELVRLPTEDVDALEAIDYIAAMELATGYVERQITVDTKSGRCTATAWVWDARRYVGARVRDNDWTHAPEWSLIDDRGFAPVTTESAPEPPPAIDSTALRLDSGADDKGEWAIRLVDADGVIHWKGYSFTECQRWIRETGAHVVKAEA